MRNWLGIGTTLSFAVLLTLLPMPSWTIWLRPAWVLMVLIYWTIKTPHRVNIGTAWIMGFVLDVLTGTMLGEHALALTFVIYWVSRAHLRINNYPLPQQAVCISFFVWVYQLIIFSIQGFIGELPASNLYWLSSVTSMLLWPWLYVLMRDCRRWLNREYVI